MRLRRLLGTLRARVMGTVVGVSAHDLHRLIGRVQVLERDTRLLAEGHRKLQAAAARADLHARIAPTMEWIRQEEVKPDVLVSVILPTRDRRDVLPAAIASVLGQSYPSWELVVVDDGSEDGTSEVLGGIDDERVRVLRGGGGGVGRARNVALDAARGELIAYLDDDNTMHPHWLKSVAWAFSRHPEADVLYGARVVEDPRLAGGEEGGAYTPIQFDPFDRRRLERENFIDIGTVAHRAHLPEARFDEELTTNGDWDLVLRLTRPRPPLTLPAVAQSYRTSSERRLAHHPAQTADVERIRARARDRPVRILAFNSMFPMVSETYIEEELEALCRHGGDLAYCRVLRPPTDVAVGRPLYQDLDRAVREFGPDLLFLHWITFAVEQLSRLEQVGLPFGVRVHSFDFDPGEARRLLDHPLCLGVWAYPHLAEQIPGARSLPTIVTSHTRMPQPAPVRDLVLSVSAGLPKKDWELLFDALSRVPGTDRRVITAVAKYYEDLPDRLRQMLARYDDPPTLHTDVPRAEVFSLLAGAAVLVYTLEPGRTFGNPMSVIEGLVAGASVVLPDRPETREFAGPGARFYRTADDIVRHLEETLAGGPEVDAERAANRRFALARFCDESLSVRFHAELTGALAAIRARS